MINKKTLVVGIAGGSASGKSTICSYIEEHLKDIKIASIHVDDYYKDIRPNIIAPITEAVYEDFNHPDSINFENLLDDLNDLKKQDFQVILIEGLMVLYKYEIRCKLDLKIFVDCQSDERLVRRIKRNLEWGESFDEITSVYLDAVRYRYNEFVEPSRWHADIILNGSKCPEKGIQVIIQWIRETVSHM